MNPRSTLLRGLIPALLGSMLFATARAEDPRAVVVIKSADALIGDLEHMVVDLAGKDKEWENNVYPNIDIFLFGVDREQPIRYDQLIGGKTGRRIQMMVPIADMDEFIQDNLDPIGIIVKEDKKDEGLYKLSDVFEGWMREANDYAYFAEKGHKDDVPPKIAPPSNTHAELLKKGYGTAAQLDNGSTTPEQRTAAFAAFRDNTLAGIQKRPDETQEAFELRKVNSEQSLETMERLFVESALVELGWANDNTKNVGVGTFILSAVPETSLAQTLKLQVQEHSRFAGVAAPQDPVLAGRMNYALGEMSTRQFETLYKLMKTPLEQRIDGTEGLTDEQKTARKEIAGLVLDMLTSSLELGKWDGVVQITQHSGGKHTGLLGICAKDSGPVAKILELLPKSASGYETELDVDSAGDVKIHKLTMTDAYPQALNDFFGDSGEVYVGAGPDAIWLSVGADAVEALKAGVAAAGKTPEGDVDPTVASLDVDLLPVLQLMNQLRKDGDFDLMATLKSRGVLEEPAPAEEGEEDPASDTAKMLQDFEWRDAAIEALDSKADRLHIDLKRVEDRLEGETRVESGILKAIGDLIAKFAKENLC